MIRPSYLAQPIVQRLPTLLDEVSAGLIQVPKFQRPFVWDDDQRLKLLDSVVRGMPIGSLYVWRTSVHDLPTYDRLGPFPMRSGEPRETRTYLLDGHQRLATLYGALREPDADDAGDHRRRGDRIRWPICVDLETSEFVLPRRAPAGMPSTWLEVSKLLNPAALYERQKRLIDAGRVDLAKRAETLANRFKDYQIPILPIVTEDLVQVTEGFQRVNNQGTPMSELHMVSAMLWTQDFDLNDRVTRMAEDFTPIGWGDIDPQLLLDIVKVGQDLDVYKARPEQLRTALARDKGLLDVIPAQVEAAARFLSDGCGVKGFLPLPYKYQLVLLAEAARVAGGSFSPSVVEQLKEWFWLTSYTEHFTGMTSTQIRAAVEHVRRIARGVAQARWEDMGTQVDPVERFAFSSVRGRAVALRLAAQNPLGPDGQATDAAAVLATHGVKGIPKILSASEVSGAGTGHDDVFDDGPENRWILAPRQQRAMHKLLRDQQDGFRAPILASHLISPEAADALGRGDREKFLQERWRAIEDIERVFVGCLGLEYLGDG